MTRPLHIVSVNQDSGISPLRRKGAAVHLTAMRQAFRKLGHVVTELDEHQEAKLHSTLLETHRNDSVDLVYERYALGRSCSARFAQAHGIPHVLEVNAPLADEQARWRGLSECNADVLADRFTFSRATFICAVSSQVAQYAIARGGRESAIQVCPNGIDTSIFNLAARADHDSAAERTSRPFVLGFHGRERPWHCFDRIVDLVQSLTQEGLPVHLKIVGLGDFDALKRLPTERYTRLEWVNHDQLPVHLSTFDAMPLTYSPDSPCYFSPLKLMEAMACGVVPIVPDLGDLASIVSNKRNGLVYPAGDGDALMQAVSSLVNDRQGCRQLGKEAAHAARGRDWTRIAQFVIDRIGRPADTRPAGRLAIQ